ncbi:hypothetical protein [Prosthecobacter sp.]|uniref:hypothetical protein n=1 Tax=Prosthecobacter sp. TaxID=1965333 RepID=UPI003784E615
MSLSSPHPIFVLAALGIASTVLMLFIAFRVRRLGLKLLLVLISVLTLAPAGLVLASAYPEWIDARYRSYKTFFADIQLGMTRDEVMAVQARLYPEGGPRKKPSILVEDERSITFFMHPEHTTEPNCEGIFLAFENGRLKSKTYSPD